MTKTAKLSRTDLSQFTGSENWYRHSLSQADAISFHNRLISIYPHLAGEEG